VAHSFWGLALLLIPIFIFPKITEDTLTSKSMLFFTMAFVGAMAIRQTQKNFPKILCLVPIFVFLNCYVYDSVAVMYQTVGLGCGLLVIKSISDAESFNKKKIINYLSAACLIQTAWVIAQYFDLNPYYWMVKNITNPLTGANLGIFRLEDAVRLKEEIGHSSGGSLSNGMYSAAIFTATIPTLFRSKWRVGLLPALWATYLLNTTMGLVSVACSILFFITYKISKENKKTVFAAFFLIFLIFVGISVHGFKRGGVLGDSGRSVHWRQMLAMPSGKIIGNGLGYLSDQFRYYQDDGRAKKVYSYAHNEFIELFIISGLAGCLLALYLFVGVFRTSYDYYLTPAFLGLLINYLGTFNLHIAGASIFFCVIYGIILRNEQEDYDD